MKELYLSENRLKSIENLNGNVQLTVLDISKNQIEQLDNLQALVHLNELWFNDNQIKNAEELTKLVSIPTLKCIYVHDNPAFDREENYRAKVLLLLKQLIQLNATETRRAAPLTLNWNISTSSHSSSPSSFLLLCKSRIPFQMTIPATNAAMRKFTQINQPFLGDLFRSITRQSLMRLALSTSCCAFFPYSRNMLSLHFFLLSFSRKLLSIWSHTLFVAFQIPLMP